MKDGFLRHLGVYGYDHVEPVILASLVSEDPLLLIGKAGTGKTFLLNSLSEALGLEHRHYNASLIAFDDLVGFPWPEKNGEQIRYIETPATDRRAEQVQARTPEQAFFTCARKEDTGLESRSASLSMGSNEPSRLRPGDWRRKLLRMRATGLGTGGSLFLPGQSRRLA
jgi:hypothetical protein